MSQMKAQVDKLLTGVSSGYFPKGYISEMVLPEVKTKQMSGLLGKYGTGHLRIENSVKGGRGKYRRIETQVRSTQQFFIEGHGLEGFVSKDDYANVEDPFDAEKDETDGVTTVLWLEKEKMLADTLTSTAIITQNTTLVGAAQFNNYTTSDPVGVITTAINTIVDATGEEPNLIIMDIKVRNRLKFHPMLVDALGYKYQKPGGLTDQEIAQAFGIERLLIARARYESAAEGQASALLPCWGKDIVICIAPETASKQQQSVGYMVRPLGSSPRKVYKEANFNPPGSTKILVEDEYDMLISNANAAYLIKDAIA